MEDENEQDLKKQINSIMSEEKEIDYLEVDQNIPGQNYVCMSFYLSLIIGQLRL